MTYEDEKAVSVKRQTAILSTSTLHCVSTSLIGICQYACRKLVKTISISIFV